jgi:hypothetical protein
VALKELIRHPVLADMAGLVGLSGWADAKPAAS